MKLNPKLIGVVGMVFSAIAMVASEYSRTDQMKKEVEKQVKEALQKED